MHIKVKLALEVVRAKLAKMRLVPDNEGSLANLMVPCPAREEGIYCGSNVLEVLLDEFALLEGGGVDGEQDARQRQHTNARWKLVGAMGHS